MKWRDEMKKTEKFSKKLKNTSYHHLLIDEFGEIAHALDKIGILVYKREDSYGKEWQEKYSFPSNIIATIDGEFKETNPGGEMTPASWDGTISLTIEYFSYSQDDLSANEQYILDQIKKIAKEHKLE